jgi:hypothetical protein
MKGRVTAGRVDCRGMLHRYGPRRFVRNDKVASSAATKQPDGQITSDYQKSCQAPESKIFLFSLPPNQGHILSIPSCSEGRWPSSRTLGGSRWTPMLRLTSAAEAYGKDAWS